MATRRNRRRRLATGTGRAAGALAAISLACLAAPVAAQDAAPTPDAALSIADMRQRDRLAAPAAELAAWQGFSETVLADPAADPALQAEVHQGLAIALLYAKDIDRAWTEMQAARTLADSLPMPPPFAPEMLAYEALILTEMGRIDEAEEKARAALSLAAQATERKAAYQALAHNALGGIAFARNDFPAAEAAYCTARDLGLAAPVPDHAMIVNDAASCGVVKYFLERPDTLAAMRLASDHAFAHLPPDHPKMGNVLNSAYGVLLRFGRYAEAEPLIRRHLDLERALYGGESDDVYDPLSMLGRALELRGNQADAEAIFTAAADMADRLRDRSQPYVRGMARTNLARVIAAQGRLEEAEQVARSGLDRLVEDLEPGDWNIGSGQVQVADHLDRLGRREEALALAEQGLAVLQAALPEGHSEVLTARLVRARILAGLGRRAEALASAQSVTASFEQQMFDLAASEEERIALSRVLPPAFADHVEVALAAGDMAQAVRAAQLFLLSELAVPNARIAAASVAREEGLGVQVVALDAARARVDELAAAFARAQADALPEAAALAEDLAAARAASAAAQAELLAAFPAYAALARPVIPTLAEIQARLAPGELLVLPLALQGQAATIVVSPTQVDWATTAIAPVALDALARQLRDAAQAPGTFDVAAAQALFELVFPAALRPALAAADTLLFPAGSYLSRLSPAVLLAGPADPDNLAAAPWLVRSHAVRMLAEPGVARSESPTLSSRAFLGIGAPEVLPGAAGGAVLREGRASLAPLPRAREELEALARTLGSAGGGGAEGNGAARQDAPSPPPLVLAGAGATEAALAGLDLSAYGVIAFATHGLAGGDVPGLNEPALLLTPQDAARPDGDGLLTASEIAALRLDADWVILSACETAAGESAGAPGYSGLARAFASAGARSLMLSHWRVRDDAAAFLTVETLRRAAAGESRAAALRQAQLALMADPAVADAAHPAVWAPFVILEM